MKITKTENSRIGSLDVGNITFGEVFGDHMLIANWENGEWSEPQIMPYGPLQISPAIMVAHYGQAAFEGMKAYKDADGQVFLFRPDKNFERLNKSAERLAMPQISEEMFIGGLKALVDLDREWVPHGEGLSLYLRPVLFASEEALKARISEKYMFAILTTPAKAYYTAPVSVKVSKYYSRAANGGVGFAKAAGNYAGAFYPTKVANEEGYDQIIWTDDATHTLMEESGTMNVMVRINDTIFTPKTSERILDGVTRDSFIQLAKHKGIEVIIGDLKVEDVYKAHKDGSLKEAWGVGTAVVTSQFKAIGYEDEKLELPQLDESESYALQLKKALVDIQTNQAEDPFGWRVLVERKN